MNNKIDDIENADSDDIKPSTKEVSNTLIEHKSTLSTFSDYGKKSLSNATEKPDPTIPFDWEDHDAFDYPIEEIMPQIEILLRERILIVDCFEPRVRVAIKKTIYQYFKDKKSEIEPRELRFEFENKFAIKNTTHQNFKANKSEIDSGEIRAEFENKVQRIIGLTDSSVSDNTLIFIDLLGSGNENFFNSLMDVKDSNDKIHINNVLNESDKYLLILISNKTQSELYRKKDSDTKFDFWQVKVVESLIRFYIQDPVIYEDTIAKLLEQRNKGLWTKQIESEESFINSLKEYLGRKNSQRKDSEFKLLRKIKEYNDEEKIEKRLEELETNHPERLIGDNSTLLNRCIIFIATYFPNITLTEFIELVEDLLIAYEPPKKVIKEEEKKLSPLEQWQTDTDGLMKANKLRLVYSEDREMRVVDFAESYEREDFENYFDNDRPADLGNFFNKLVFVRKLAFNSNGFVLWNIINLYENLVIQNPDYYINDFLQKLLFYDESVEDNLKNLDDIEVISNGFKKANRKIGEYRVLSLFIDKVAYHPKESIRNRIKSFLNTLISFKFFKNMEEGDESFDHIAFALINSLKYNPQFDKAYWFRQLLERATNITKIVTYQLLINNICDEEEPMVANDFIKVVKDWVYSDNNKSEQLRMLGLEFIFDYSIILNNRIPYTDYGSNEPNYQLFKIYNLVEDKKIFITNIIKWLLDKDQKTEMEILGIKGKHETKNLTAWILEEWYAILLGFDENIIENHANKPITQQLLLSVIENAPKEIQRFLIESWREKSEYYFNVLDNIDYSQKEIRKSYRDRRGSIRRLINDFKELQQLKP
ncbi:MAG: hypothetical protein MUF58_15375 [Arcicella sp.]|jgi:hypothetical protein|nr:hypothetical protein [Arcicella sp.]